jgi:RNA recognition motif-containing protein
MGDLDPWSDEEAIVKLWESLGKRVLVKVIKAKRGTPAATLNTGHAGYCFVEFESYDDAKSVLALNGSQIPNTNRLFRLNWASGATLSSPIPQSPEYSLFVGDLSPSTTEAHLLALFQTHFKSVKTVRVMTDPITGTSRCFGFVRFSDEEERRRALTEMSGVWCAGRPLRVALATPRAQGNSQGLVQPGVIGGSFPGQQFQPFPGQQAPQQQNDMMMFQYQQVPPPSIPYYPAEAQQQQQQQQQQHQQQQHQQHQQHPQAQQEMTALQSAQSSGNGIPPMQSMPYSDPNNTTVFVGGLAAGASEQTLAALFQPFGPIAHIKIPPNKGCGFIRFENREDAMNAINAMQGFSIGGSRIRLSWGRQQNQQRLQMAMAAAMQGGPLPIQQGGPTIAPPVSSTGFSQPMMAPVNSMYYLATDQKFAYDGSPFPSIGNEQQYLQAMEYEEKENDKEQGRDGTPDNDGVTKLQEMYNAAVAGKLDSLN